MIENGNLMLVMYSTLRKLWPRILISVLIICASILLGKWLVNRAGRAAGWYLKRYALARKKAIIRRVKIEEEAAQKFNRRSQKSEDDEWEKIESYGTASAINGGQADDDWEGIIGFFHPFCNAGGGGERVLWAAIKATQNRWPKAICVVYTGDHDSTKPAILERVQNRFNIRLHPPTVVFIYLSTRHYVLSTTYPHFTLLGQSLGSLILAYDAFSLLVPDVFVDTMGYAFTLAFCKFLFPTIPTGAYVHYPTISTDMLGSLDAEVGKGLNAGAGKGFKGALKRRYWHIFAWMYCWVGGTVDVVMTNSSWTQGHIQSLWGPKRTKRHKKSEIQVVFPPVAVEELEQAIEINEISDSKREPAILYVAQFRPEKNHALILRAFAKMLENSKDHATNAVNTARLVLVGSVRNSEDATRVYDLRLLAHELKVKDQVEFLCDAPWSDILGWLRKSWVGVNGMWNEHFGIGVVEYQAAGLISVVNDSGGPKYDIVIEYDGGPTGYQASTEAEFAAAFNKALTMPRDDTLAMRRRARASARRFTEKAFAKTWILQMETLVSLQSSIKKL